MTLKVTQWLCVAMLTIITSTSLKAQEIKGVATYQTKTTVDMSRFNRDGQQMSEQRKKQIMERMKNFLEKEYTLAFTKEESFYKEEEKLAAPGQGGGWGGGFAQGGIYKNITENAYARENNMMGKTFLVKDTLNNLEWVLEKESKMIGQYPAFKAVATRPASEIGWGSWRRDDDKKKEKKEGDETASDTEEPEADAPKMETIVAWYTPMIPVGHGPDDYNGLPGLILEINNGRTTILCTKVVLNPKDEVVIEQPTKGKEVTRTEYETTMKEKMEEMRERYGGGRGGRGRGRGPRG